MCRRVARRGPGGGGCLRSKHEANQCCSGLEALQLQPVFAGARVWFDGGWHTVSPARGGGGGAAEGCAGVWPGGGGGGAM